MLPVWRHCAMDTALLKLSLALSHCQQFHYLLHSRSKVSNAFSPHGRNPHISYFLPLYEECRASYPWISLWKRYRWPCSSLLEFPVFQSGFETLVAPWFSHLLLIVHANGCILSQCWLITCQLTLPDSHLHYFASLFPLWVNSRHCMLPGINDSFWAFCCPRQFMWQFYYSSWVPEYELRITISVCQELSLRVSKCRGLLTQRICISKLHFRVTRKFKQI